jgi:hypothetical protein
VQCPTIVFDRLLNEKEELTSNSKKVYSNALIPKDVDKEKGQIHRYWQMERLGYFKFDECGNFIRCTALT